MSVFWKNAEWFTESSIGICCTYIVTQVKCLCIYASRLIVLITYIILWLWKISKNNAWWIRPLWMSWMTNLPSNWRNKRRYSHKIPCIGSGTGTGTGTGTVPLADTVPLTATGTVIFKRSLLRFFSLFKDNFNIRLIFFFFFSNWPTKILPSN